MPLHCRFYFLGYQIHIFHLRRYSIKQLVGVMRYIVRGGEPFNVEDFLPAESGERADVQGMMGMISRMCLLYFKIARVHECAVV
jgi:hypothetical protein